MKRSGGSKRSGPRGCAVMKAWDTRVHEGGKSWLITFKQLKWGNFWGGLCVLAALVLSRNSCEVWSGELKMRQRRLWTSCPNPLAGTYTRGCLLWTPMLKNNCFFLCFTTLSLSTVQVTVRSVPRTSSQTVAVRDLEAKYPRPLALRWQNRKHYLISSLRVTDWLGKRTIINFLLFLSLTPLLPYHFAESPMTSLPLYPFLRSCFWGARNL